MAINVEWKARVHDLQNQRELAERIAGSPPALLEQIDTFFAVAHGRLKLRRLSPDRGELIHYWRVDRSGPRQSNYSIVRTAEPDALCDLLASALGVRGVVRKRRWLYLADQVRIHLDKVEGLGHFLEVEVVMRPGQPIADGERLAEALMGQLDVRAEDLVAGAYVDLFP
jgi:adenylate cyclase class IV